MSMAPVVSLYVYDFGRALPGRTGCDFSWN
jgi:hypothetical protein